MEIKNKILMNGLDIIDAITILNKKNKKFQALLLEDVESYINKDTELYKKLRKSILDYFNDFSRSVARIITGDEDEIQQ